ncbi:uncharacterized protein [Dermacentor andersoni]|uniref:uncharacterized protein isoform X1 n=2 Tax=Dermacentor andersoni TaxID=34620 RepID=UPI002415FF58|nr:uncharacterized protein LOC126536612 isoform X1 [Dermacentor andersoni]
MMQHWNSNCLVTPSTCYAYSGGVVHLPLRRTGRLRSPMDGASGSNWTDVGDNEAGGPFSSATVTASVSGSSLSTSSTPSPYLYHGGRVLYTTSTLTPEAARSQYYAAYDPMTGLRIAATLGAIITLFTLFLIYKSKCRPAKPTEPQEGV